MFRATVRASSKLSELTTLGKQRASVAARKAAFDIVAEAAERSRVDTGAMKGGWQAGGGLLVDGGLSDKLVVTQENDGTKITVGNPYEHAIYNEFGTVHMTAKPMARPAALKVWPAFVEAMRQIYGR